MTREIVKRIHSLDAMMKDMSVMRLTHPGVEPDAPSAHEVLPSGAVARARHERGRGP